MDSLELKVPSQDVLSHLAEIRHISNTEKKFLENQRQIKRLYHKKTVSTDTQELKTITSRQKKGKPIKITALEPRVKIVSIPATKRITVQPIKMHELV